MLKSLWHNLVRAGRRGVDAQALASYFRAEGLRGELEALQASRASVQSRYERLTHATRAHLAA